METSYLKTLELDKIIARAAEGCVCKEAREKMLELEPQCDPEHCLYARGHYDRVNEAVYTFLQNQDYGGREELLDWAEQYQVCPFAFSLDVSSFADAVVGDYN